MKGSKGRETPEEHKKQMTSVISAESQGTLWETTRAIRMNFNTSKKGEGTGCLTMLRERLMLIKWWRRPLQYGGNTFSNSEKGEHNKDFSMMVVKDNEDKFNSIFSLMSKTDDEDNKEEVTLLDLKGDISTLPIKRFRKLAIVLINSIDELTNEKMVLSENLDLCLDENSALISQMSEMNVRLSIMKT